MAGERMSKQSSNLLNLTQAADAAGVTRKTLYAHIDKGLVSVVRKQNKRYIDVSELIRHYGTVSLPVEKLNTTTQIQSIQENDALQAIKQELTALRKLVESQQHLLEDKQAVSHLRESVAALQNERDTTLVELDKVRSELNAERKKGFLQRLFNR